MDPHHGQHGHRLPGLFDTVTAKAKELFSDRFIFQSTFEDEATVKMSRLPVSAQQGTTILEEAVPFHTGPA